MGKKDPPQMGWLEFGLACLGVLAFASLFVGEVTWPGTFLKFGALALICWLLPRASQREGDSPTKKGK